MTEISTTNSITHKKGEIAAGTNNSSSLKNSNWNVTNTVGGKISNVNPLFTPDKSHFIVLTSLEVRIYLLATRKCVRSIPLDTSNITDMSVLTDDDNGKRILISRSNGECSIINWEEKQIETTIKTDIPIIRKIVLVLSPSQFLFLSEPTGTTELSLVLYDTTASKSTIIHNCKNGKLFSISNSGKYFAFQSTLKKVDHITVGELSDDRDNVVKQRTFKRSKPILSMAVSDDALVAVGSESGVVDVYYESLSSSNQGGSLSDIPPVRALKWHVDSVLTLSFSLDGDYLLSGGKEKVLVFWQLETDNTQFLPRLGGEINSIIVDPSSELYSLNLGGEEVIVLSAVDLVSRLQVSGVKAAFNKLPSDPEKEKKRRRRHGGSENERVSDFTAQYYIDPQTKNAYFPTKNQSQLQVYDSVKDEQDSVMTVASTLQTGKVRKEELIQDPRITQVSFTTDGKWMATVDETTTPPIDGLLSRDDKAISLKFWHRNDKNGKWELATRVTAPHGPNKCILDIIPADPSFHNGHAFVTAAQDGGVRLWRPSFVNEIGNEDNKNKNNKQPTPRTVAWSVRKILPPGAMSSSAVSLAWSEDSSVIILGFESSIYVIDASKFTIHRTMANMLGSRVRSLKIMGNYLIALSKTRLVVWNLLNDGQVWSLMVPVPTDGKRLIAYDNSSKRFALAVNYFTKDFKVESKVFIFDVTSPLPVHISTHNQGISAINQIPGTNSFSFLDVKARISTLDIRDTSAVNNVESAADDFTAEITQLYNIKQHAQILPEVIDEDEDNTHVLNIHSFDKVFDGSEYSLDSLESLFDKVLGVISPKRQ